MRHPKFIERQREATPLTPMDIRSIRRTYNHESAQRIEQRVRDAEAERQKDKKPYFEVYLENGVMLISSGGIIVLGILGFFGILT